MPEIVEKQLVDDQFHITILDILDNCITKEQMEESSLQELKNLRPKIVILVDGLQERYVKRKTSNTKAVKRNESATEIENDHKNISL
jgi:hypothetical protein